VRKRADRVQPARNLIPNRRQVLVHERSERVGVRRRLEIADEQQVVDLKLTTAARSHSREMIEEDYFSHSSYDGESVGERLKRFGYDLIIHGENLAGGTAAFGEPDSAFQRWMNSQDHRATVLDSRFRPVGVGTYTGDYKGFQEYTMYTVDFGVRR
jgi:uncharacterized protein YkwD